MALPAPQKPTTPDFLQYKTAPVPEPQVQSNLSGFDGTTAPLSAAVLAPTTPLNIPAAPAPTEAPAFGSYLEGLGKATTDAAAKKESSFDELIAGLSSSSTEGDLTNQAYGAKGGVDETEMELNDINAQLLGEQEGLRRTIENIQDNAEGLTRSGVAGKIDEATRKSYRTQADLAVIQMAKQGRYNSAKAIADRAVSAQLERQKQRNELLRFAYDENKESFTTAEQREFETKQAERERQLENEEYRLRAKFDAQIKQSDPLYQAQLAKAMFDLEKARTDGLPKKATPLQLAKMEGSINDIRGLAKDPALRGSVGTTPLGRFAPVQAFTGSKSNFIASVEQLRSGLTLENLIQAKANGATFGGLSDGERETLAAAATKIGTWAKVKDGKVVGYDTDATSFQKELDTINYYQQLDYVIKGGDPASAGIQITPDGKMWTENSDGSFSELITEL